MIRRFEIELAIRHLRSGGWQTILTVSGVAMAVTLVVFISSMIYGLEKQFSRQLTDYIPHITIKPREAKPVPLAQMERDRATGELIVTEVEPQTTQRKFIEEWRKAVATIRKLPHVEHIAPSVTGQAFIRRGALSPGITVYGADPEDQEPIAALNSYLVRGHYLGLTAEEAVIGWALAKDLDVAVGDRVRITSSEGATQPFTIAGIYDTGQDLNDRVRVFVTLRAAQSLFGTGNYVSAITLKLDEMFTANDVADRIQALLPYEVESWMREYVELTSIILVQREASLLISAFSLIASSLGIASVLIVSVMQKSRQIGILKAMGATRRQILVVFTLEGLFIALVGAAVGALLGSALLAALQPLKQPPRPSGRLPDPLFPIVFSAWILLSARAAAVFTTLVASILPARRAARLDPVQVIRGG
jgi:lipoprotein-releasing system permease protein